MRIAVIADTHDKLPAHLIEALRGAGEIWHLGDVTDESIILRLRGIGAPVYVVRGNNDACERWPLRLLLDRGGRSFLLIHLPPSRPGGADFLLHGHTHVPRDEQAGPTRVLNPGAVGKPNKGAPPSYAWLDVDEATGAVAWTIVLL